jgi:putative transposase
MEEDTVVRLPRPGASLADDPLLEVLRSGARRMLQQVIEAEVEAFLAAHAELEDAHGRRRLVRNGHAPEREVQTGIGPIAVRRPKLRDRGDGAGGERIRFTSKVLPPFPRRTRNVEELLPWLYLKGISTGQFEEALTALLGPDAPGLSAPTVRRLMATWQQDHERWQRRDLTTRRYVYVWADGVYFTPRLDHDRQCILVLIGAAADGRKELLAIEDGYRESSQSWRELLLRLRDENGLATAPELATGDGALGFWKALHEVWPTTRQQRCWVHKTANVLNALPKSVQGKAKKDLHAIYEAESRADAGTAFDRFVDKYGAKYDKARPRRARSRTAQRCSPSTTSRPSIGNTSAARTRSRAPSRRCDAGPTRPRAASHARRRSPWSSSSPSRPSATGAGSTAPSGLASSSRASGSAMVRPSKMPRSKPPPEPVHQD